jgi:hypothetical protein
MPGRNGTGPMGKGAMTGRGLGNCTGTNAVSVVGTGMRRGFGFGAGRGCGFGMKRGFGAIPMTENSEKELLLEQTALLQERIDAITKQLENLKVPN